MSAPHTMPHATRDIRADMLRRRSRWGQLPNAIPEHDEVLDAIGETRYIQQLCTWIRDEVYSRDQEQDQYQEGQP